MVMCALLLGRVVLPGILIQISCFGNVLDIRARLKGMPRMTAARLRIFDIVMRARILQASGLPKVQCYSCRKTLRISSWIAHVGDIERAKYYERRNSKAPKIYHVRCYMRMWH